LSAVLFESCDPPNTINIALPAEMSDGGVLNGTIDMGEFPPCVDPASFVRVTYECV